VHCNFVQIPLDPFELVHAHLRIYVILP
jgi:hypothetical protein